MTQEEQIEKVYRVNYPRLMEALADVQAEEHLSQPLLLDLDAHGYLSAPLRLMVVGQQTCGWGKTAAPGSADSLLNHYREFALGREYRSTPFWDASHEIYRALCPKGPERGFLWSNLVKIDQGGKRPDPEIEDRIAAHFDVLREEVAIAKPDAVVFFTGPDYDERLKSTFDGVQFRSVVRTHGRRVLAVLEHQSLPAASFRTYHPKYLRLSGRWEIVERLPAWIRAILVGTREGE